MTPCDGEKSRSDWVTWFTESHVLTFHDTHPEPLSAVRVRVRVPVPELRSSPLMTGVTFTAGPAGVSAGACGWDCWDGWDDGDEG